MTTFNATIAGTVAISNSVSSTLSAFGGSIGVNQLGSVTSSDGFSVFHNGTVIPAFEVETLRSLSVAGSLMFKTPKLDGSDIALLDRVEMGYRGHQSFYGWVYSVDKSDEYVYTVTAYDGGWGLAQINTFPSFFIPPAATMNASFVLGLLALQVTGLGSNQQDKLGIRFNANTVPFGFGWDFTQGQALAKIESIMLGNGNVVAIDAFSNVTLPNWQNVGVIRLQENVDYFVVNSRAFNPITEYGAWVVDSYGTIGGGGTLYTASAGTGKPFRTLGGQWLIGTSTALLGTIAAKYQGIFDDGVWVIEAWSPFWYDPAGIDISGSWSAFLGDGSYGWIASTGTLGIQGVSLTGGTTIGSVAALPTGGAVWVLNSGTPMLCVVENNSIVKQSGWAVNNPQNVATFAVGLAGSLLGQSIAYDGFDTLYTAQINQIVSTNYISTKTAILAGVPGTILTICAPAPQTAYVGTSNGIYTQAGIQIIGTSGMNVTALFADVALGVVYACIGSTVVPYFAVGAGTLSGFLPASIVATVGVSMSDGTGRVFFGGDISGGTGGSIIVGMQAGTIFATATMFSPEVGTVTATTKISDMFFDPVAQQPYVVSNTTGTAAASGLWTYPLAITSSIAIGTGIQISTVTSGIGNAKGTQGFITQQNLYQLTFADGMVLYDCIIATVQVTQSGVYLTFFSGQGTVNPSWNWLIAPTFHGAPDITQLTLWNNVNTSETR